MALEREDVRKLAMLARLELPDEELDQIGPQLERILGFVDQLSSLDTENVEPMTTALEVDNRWRDDVAFEGLSRDDALRNAPARDEEYFLVPAVLGTAAARS
jgi:aspartyl-tRNA(Asn)/glutamyl-tRNA(Gln) amidotransferase subunit C